MLGLSVRSSVRLLMAALRAALIVFLLMGFETRDCMASLMREMTSGVCCCSVADCMKTKPVLWE